MVALVAHRTDVVMIAGLLERTVATTIVAAVVATIVHRGAMIMRVTKSSMIAHLANVCLFLKKARGLPS